MATYIRVREWAIWHQFLLFFITIGINFEIENQPSKTQIIHVALERPTKTNKKNIFSTN